MICRNINELKAEIERRIEDALVNEVAVVVKEVVYKHILSDVYNFPQARYARRGAYDGLGDMDNTYSRLVNKNTLSVENIAKTNPYLNGIDTSLKFPNNSFTQRGYSAHMDKDYLAPIVESGNGYDYKSPGARPFMQNSYEELIDFGAHIKAMKEGLRRQGLNVL